MKKTVLRTLLISLAAFMLTGCVLYNGRNKDGSPKGGGSSQTSSETSESGGDISSSEGGGEEESSSSSSEVTPPPEGMVNLYFVLGPHGMLNGDAGHNVEAKFLEHTIVSQLAYGADLPTATEVTSSISGSTFSHWVDRATTEQVSKVTVDSHITEQVLVAVFGGGEGGNTPIAPEDGLPDSGFGFLFSDHTKETPHYKVAVDAQDEGDFKQKKIADFQMIQGQQFQLYDFGEKAGWTVPLDTHSCGGQPDKYITRGESWYTVNETFNAIDIYIKLKLGEDQLYIGKEREPGDLPDSGFGFLFKTEAGVEPYYKLSTDVGMDGDYHQYKIDDFRLVQGQQFQIYDFGNSAGWTVELDPYSCGSNPSAYITKGDTWYAVIQTFDAVDIYIKTKYQADQLYIGLAGGSTPEPDPSSVPTTIYFAPNASWKSDGAKFAIYFSDETWAMGTDSDSDGIYEFDNSAKKTQVIFVRLSSTATAGSWTDKWNQSPAQDQGFHSVPTDGKNLATAGDGWDGCSITWSVKA